jgi:cell division protein FtsL
MNQKVLKQKITNLEKTSKTLVDPVSSHALKEALSIIDVLIKQTDAEKVSLNKIINSQQFAIDKLKTSVKELSHNPKV